MKLLAFIGLVASANAAPIELVGGVTKEIACKDYVDYQANVIDYYNIDDCVEAEGDVYNKCSKRAFLPLSDDRTDAFYVAADWDAAVEKCIGVFVTESAGDKKCLQVLYEGTPNEFSCEAYLTPAQSELDALTQGLFDL